MKTHALSSLVTACLLLPLATAPGAPPKGIVRGIYCRPGLAADSRLWTKYGSGYTLDSEVAHTGKTSIRCQNADDTQAQGALQAIELNQPKARPIIVAGWAKLENVQGEASYKCSVYLDLRLQDGKSWPMKIAAFDPAKTGWQYVEKTYTPPGPITSARVYAFLREKTGTAWFDDLYVGEILDEAGKRSPNRLESAGFERAADRENIHREQFFAKLEAMNCNAFHFYKSVAWDAVTAPEGLPPIAKDDPLPEFVATARERGLRSWLTVGLGLPAVKDKTSPGFPIHGCVNHRWGQAYTQAVAHFARYGVDGIGVVPDEWTFTTGRLKRAYAKHSNPEVAAHYKSLSGHAQCPVCHARFKEQYGVEYPDMAKPWSTSDPVWAKLLEFRYQETTEWMRQTVQAAKKVDPDVVTDTMICVLPVCSDDRIGAGAAWDMVGAKTGLDCLQTDPYIILHNYRGDSTHYYATETAIHLTAANWPRRSGVTLEASRLREQYRRMDPAEVYGTALSCLMHGSREFFWWHMNHVTGKSAFVDAPKAEARVTAAYEVMREMEPYVLDSATSAEVLVLYSRRSEDTWHWLARAKAKIASEITLEAQAGDDGEPLRAIKTNERRGFLAHRNVLYWLLRRGYPFQTTFIERPDPAKLQAAKVVLVPFPLALEEAEAQRIAQLARNGAKVVIMSELSPLDSVGRTLPKPRLAALFGADAPDKNTPGPVVATVGKGQVVFLGNDFARRLFNDSEPQKDRAARVPVLDFNGPRTAVLEHTLGTSQRVLARQPDVDVEVTMAKGSQGKVLLAINWDLVQTATVALQPAALGNATQARGFSIDANAKVTSVIYALPSLQLAPQQAVLLHLR